MKTGVFRHVLFFLLFAPFYLLISLKEKVLKIISKELIIKYFFTILTEVIVLLVDGSPIINFYKLQFILIFLIFIFDRVGLLLIQHHWTICVMWQLFTLFAFGCGSIFNYVLLMLNDRIHSVKCIWMWFIIDECETVDVLTCDGLEFF